MCASRLGGMRCAQGCLGQSCCRTGPGLSPAHVPAAQGVSVPCRLPPGRSEGPHGVLPCFCPGISLVPQLCRVTACPCPPASHGAGEGQVNPEAGKGWSDPTDQAHSGEPEVPLCLPGGPPVASGPDTQAVTGVLQNVVASPPRLLPRSCAHPCRGLPLLPSPSGTAPGLASPPTAAARWPVPERMCPRDSGLNPDPQGGGISRCCLGGGVGFAHDGAAPSAGHLSCETPGAPGLLPGEQTQGTQPSLTQDAGPPRIPSPPASGSRTFMPGP